MNVIAIARRGIGVVGVPPVGIAVARGIAIELIRHAEPGALVVQVAAADPEAVWLAKLASMVRRAPLPRGIAFAIRVSNAARPIGAVLVAEHEHDLGHRLGCVIRLGPEAIVLDRRDGSPPTPVSPAFVDRAEAEALVRRWSAARAA